MLEFSIKLYKSYTEPSIKLFSVALFSNLFHPKQMKKLWILSLFAILLLAWCNKNVEPKEVQIDSKLNTETQNETKTWNIITSTVDKITEDIKEKVNNKTSESWLNIYESKKWNFTLKFNPHRSFQENIWNSIVMFSREGLINDSKSSLSISQLELSAPEQKISLEDYYNENKLSIRDAIIDFTELSQKKIKIDWNPALEVIYNWEQSNQKFQVKQVFFHSSNNMFIVTYLSSEDVFSTYSSEVDEIVNSIKLK